MRIFLVFMLAFSALSLAYAIEPIVDFKDKDKVVLNDGLRRLDQDIRNNAAMDIWDSTGSDIKLKTADDIDFQQKQGKGLAIENRTDDPGSPVTGQIWFRTDI